MQTPDTCVVVLGTGGTIAGTAPSAQSHVGYRAGALSADALVAAVSPLGGQRVETESVAQADSCDMDHATWARLLQRLRWHLARPEVAGAVVTHGTDTLEETAYFVHRTLAGSKPVVLTAAMRPATALSPDGPQNLYDAVTVARVPGAQGVLVALGGVVHAAANLRKVHGYRVDAFCSGDAGAVALIEDGVVRVLHGWPQAGPHPAAAALPDPHDWPAVDIVTSHAGARGTAIDAAVSAGARGIVIAGTGNGTVHAELLAAARRAVDAGVDVRRASRCILGGVVGAAVVAGDGVLPSTGVLTPYQARIEVMLDLMAR